MEIITQQRHRTEGRGQREPCHHRYSATGECLYLIRPDGYIGYRTQPADVFKLWAYLQKINIFQSVDEMHSLSLSR